MKKRNCLFGYWFLFSCLDGRSGREQFKDGGITIECASEVLKYEEKLMTNKTIDETRRVLQFYENLGLGSFLLLSFSLP